MKHNRHLKARSLNRKETTEAREDFNYKLHFTKIASNRNAAVQMFRVRWGGVRETFAAGRASPCSVTARRTSSLASDK